MTNDADTVARDVAAVADPSATAEVIAAVRVRVLGRAEALLRQARELKAAIDDAMLQHIEATGEDIVIGDVRFYAGIERTTKCLHLADTFDALFTATGGDVTRFCDCLAAGAFKPGAAKSVLPAADYARLFETTERPELREGKPVRKLKSVNTKFLKGTDYDRGNTTEIGATAE